ncbi:MAG: DNA primase, partial [Ignisphaera sp.]
IADIDYVARAPPGKEVEELTAKEIAKALKNAVPVKQFLEQLEKKTVDVSEVETKSLIQQPIMQTLEVTESIPIQQAPIQTSQQMPQQIAVEKPIEGVIEIPVNIIEEGKRILGNLEALLYDDQWNIVERVPVRDLVDKLSQIEYGKVQAIIFDGIITQRLLDTASSKGVKLIIGVRLGNVAKKPDSIITMTFNDILSVMQR